MTRPSTSLAAVRSACAAGSEAQCLIAYCTTDVHNRHTFPFDLGWLQPKELVLEVRHSGFELAHQTRLPHSTSLDLVT